jgi:hypothetical protein
MKEKTREEYRQSMENQYNSGTLSMREMTEALGQYDAAQATLRNAKYMAWREALAGRCT